MNDLFYLTDEQRMIRDLARKVARERIMIHHPDYLPSVDTGPIFRHGRSKCKINPHTRRTTPIS